jgi:hypothetical protein
VVCVNTSLQHRHDVIFILSTWEERDVLQTQWLKDILLAIFA